MDQVLDSSIAMEGLGRKAFALLDAPRRELLGSASEPRASLGEKQSGILARKTIDQPELVQRFDSRLAMRFGPRVYGDEQFEQIRQATAERDEPSAPGVPIDD